MRLGAHISVAGGAYKAFGRAAEAGCESMLIFTKSNRQWNAKEITDEDVTAYKKAQEQYPDIHPVAVHASYLINVASPDPELWEKSYLALKDEVERAAAYNIPLLTFHPGSRMTDEPGAGLDLIARALNRLLDETAASAPNTTICLENMAGQGTNVGDDFVELGYLLDEVGRHDRIGVCFDTCHAFAAGYDIRTPDEYAATMSIFDEAVGLDEIRCFHLNDSKFELGEKKDRHEHIGRGEIGLEGFANFVNDPRWANHPAHLETPKTEKDDDGNEIEMDAVNLETLRGLITG